LTHTSPTAAYWAAGSDYIIERLSTLPRGRPASPSGGDAEHDPPEQMPHRNAMDKTYDSGRFESIMDQSCRGLVRVRCAAGGDETAGRFARRGRRVSR
jgi:hypothetical protein